jgi:hypothetical protein
MIEGDTIRRIREAVAAGRLTEPFRADDVNRALGITFAGTFLPKHRTRNPGRNTELFIQVERGLYRLKPWTPYVCPEPAALAPIIAASDFNAEFAELDKFKRTPDEEFNLQVLRLRKARAEFEPGNEPKRRRR